MRGSHAWLTVAALLGVSLAAAQGAPPEENRIAITSKLLPAVVARRPTARIPNAAQRLRDGRLQRAALNVVEPRPLSLADLESLALANHPGLGQAAAEWRAAQGEWVQVGLPPNLIAGYVGSQMGDGGTAGQQGGYLEQEFITAGKLRLNRAAAAANVRARGQELRAMQMRVVNDVRMRFYDALVAQETRTVAERLAFIADEGERTAAALLKEEFGNRIDLLQATVEAETARITAVNAGNRHQAAWRQLAAVVGTPFMPTQPLSGSLKGVAPQLDFASMIRRLYNESPERAAALERLVGARWSLERAIAEPVPNIDVQSMIQQNQFTGEANIGLQVTMPLPLWNRNQGGVRKAQSEVAAARANVSRVELDLQQRLAAAFERYGNSRQQAERYETKILPAAEESLQLVTTGWREGEFDYITRLTAQRTFFQANLSYLQALGELRSSVVEIEGLLLTDSLTTAASGE